jgi:hypothetical protein
MKIRSLFLALALVLLAGALAAAQNEKQGKAVVTLLPKQENAPLVAVAGLDLSITLDNHKAKETALIPYSAPNDKVELVILLDSAQRGTLGRQLNELEQFIKGLPPNISAAFAYMQNGNAALASPLSNNPAETLKGLHMPGGSLGSSASPYFCLSDLAKRWPSQDATARRAVLMISDGVDPYHPEIDDEDPYLDKATDDAARAHLAVYSIYWRDNMHISLTGHDSFVGQNMLARAAQETGGKSFYMGTGNPVTFTSYFDELLRRFRNQYELSFTVPVNGKQDVGELRLKLHIHDAEVDTPEKVLLTPVAK